ncbi:MAG: hypothetical protein DRH79_06505 [Candidatus Cloacimonadota bacterium]|nr:MAG: hypothetical protein DRH79_06505 [Candidatus Cloacimonadota bacterium]
MKRSLVALLLFTSLSLIAVTESFKFKTDDIQLELENVILKDVEFHKSDLIEVRYDDSAEIKFEQSAQVLSIMAQKEKTKIRLYLPQDKKYMYENSDGICTFDKKTLNFDADDAFIIISEDGLKVKDYSDGDCVIINDDGIIVDNSDEQICITDSGVHIEGDESIHIEGLLGFIVGAFVKGVSNAALSSIGKTPDRIFKYIVNNEDEENYLELSRS